MSLLLEKIRKNSLLLGPNIHWFLFLEEEDSLPLVCTYTDRDNNILIAVRPASAEEYMNVYKVQYNPHFRNSTIHQLGTWYAQNKSSIDKENLRSFSAKTDLQGRTLKVALERHFPFFIPANETGERNPSGVDIEVLNALQEVFKFRYEIHRPSDGKWGSPVSNRSWNGMIGMVHRQEVDIAMGGMTISQTRKEAVDFSFAYCFDRTTFVTRAPSEASRAWVIVLPFQWGVWLAIGLAVTLISQERALPSGLRD
ncbi:glutamate receptor ionotropic, delta-1-like [Limulus polyphemus]|uniref:Glutamate receptor ionotropic, delta-1-like n=1 Tax=Limulus polyphemus TaxID=6850 RepID=A0ABM1T790_LIMPO|nr:glutamate receptor ionotropic, delta-1-like [Limulus polyphemus]